MKYPSEKRGLVPSLQFSYHNTAILEQYRMILVWICVSSAYQKNYAKTGKRHGFLWRPPRDSTVLHAARQLRRMGK